MIKKPHESSVITFSPRESIKARKEIFKAMQSYQATNDEKERSLGLFLRGSLLARILAIADIYREIVEIPGSILDIGTWRGQTAVLCENLRSIYEPLNFNRRIICFDTFEGYLGYSDKDRKSLLHHDGAYALDGENYAQFLREFLALHEKSNAMGHNHGKHLVIKGDCREEIPRFFSDNPHEFSVLAFFDLNAYLPTLEAVQQVLRHIVPGGILAFWQLSRGSGGGGGIAAEGRVYSEHILTALPHTLHRSQTYPSLCYMKKTCGS
jgi:SAM-dependent methyltransferase